MALTALARQWLFLGTVLLALGSLIGYVQFDNHQRIGVQEQERLSALADMLGKNIAPQLALADRIIANISKELPAWSARNDGFVVANRELKIINETINGIPPLLVMDAVGTVIVSSDPHLLGMNFAHRDYFKTAVQLSDPGVLHISSPFTTVLGDFAFTVLRSVRGPGGEFSGVVIVTEVPAYFTPLLESVRYASDMQSAIVHGDGSLFLLSPAPPVNGARDIAKPGSFVARHLQQGKPSSVFTGMDALTGELRMSAQQTVRLSTAAMDQPLIVSVSRQWNAMYAQWDQQAAVQGGLYALLLVTAVVGLHFLQKRRLGYDQLVRERQAQRERAEAALREDYEIQRSILETSLDGFWSVDDQGRLQDINSTYCQQSGYTREELLGMRVDDLVAPDNAADSDLHLQRVKQIGHERFESRHCRKDGSIWDVEVSVSSRDAAQRSLFLFLRDITERKKVEGERLLAQDALRDSEERMRLVFDNVPVGIFISTRDGKFIYVNPALPRILGYDSPTELVTEVNRTSIAQALYVEPQRRQVVIAEFERNHGRWHTAENSYRRKDGTVVDAILSLGEQYDSAAAESRYCGVITDISERKRFEQELTESRERFRALSEAAFEAIFISENGYCVEQNQRAEQLFGYTADEALGRFGTDWVIPADRERVIKNMTAGYELPYEVTGLRKDGSTFAARVRAKIMRYQGRTVQVISMNDISERKKAQEAILRERDFSRAALDSLPGLFYLIDQQGHFLRWNQNFEAVSGYNGDEISTMSPLDFFAPAEQGMIADAIARVYATGEAQVEAEFLSKNRSKTPFLFTGKRCTFDQQPCLMGMGIDFTESRLAADKIEHLAFYDSLTDLPNRRLLLDRLEQAIAGTVRHNRCGALMLLDMDDFKALNDTLGHDVGDQFLMAVSTRLGAAVREGDTVARLGGDEFVVILEDLSADAHATMQAENVGLKILRTVSQPYRLDLTAQGGLENARNYHCTSSIGIALFRDSSVSVDELMRRADTAMYQAKAAGRNTLRFFDPDMQADVTARAALDHDLREAVREGQFCLHYQPQVDHGGQCTGAEALVRWQHPRRGLVPPSQFIAQAEATGLILAIGQWVLDAACAQLVAWEAMPQMAHLTVAVNVSARQFRDAGFVKQVLASIERTAVNPKKLKLELTESLLLDNVEDTIAKMAALKAIGISFSLDDFGTGYSSLSYLKRLPLDQLKIDQSFVRDVLTDPNDAAIARTIVALAHSMGLAVIAEGVETEAQRAFLVANGCTAFQGFLFGRPVPVADFCQKIA